VWKQNNHESKFHAEKNETNTGQGVRAKGGGGEN